MKQLIKNIYLLWLKRRVGHLGENSYLSPFGSYLHAKKIFIGDNVYIGYRAIISASEGIQIGNGVVIGPEFMVMGGDHNFRKVGSLLHQVKTNGINKPILIEE